MCTTVHVLQNEQHIGEYNMLQLFHELTTRSKYEPPETSEQTTPKLQGYYYI